MAENKMKEVAKLLEVEMGVPFKIKCSIDNPHKITEDGLIDRDAHECTRKLSYLINGKLEVEKPILDKVEKRYLENVLRPFKDRVIDITKTKDLDMEFIRVQLKKDVMLFPNFEKGIMYKGMELNRRYTLEKLGLFEEE